MARPSKLSDAQWAEIKRRLAAGEKPAALAKEFGVSRSTISERCQKQANDVKDVASQLVKADTALRSLPVSEQLLAINLADELRAISFHLAGAARYGAATAHRLSAIANAKVEEIDDAAPLNAESVEALKGVSVLTKMANEASSIGVNLLAANKETVKKINEPPEADSDDDARANALAQRLEAEIEAEAASGTAR